MQSHYVGIDLGTTNSAVATYDGAALQIVTNGSGEPLTPSVVRIDARGGVSVGRRAQRLLESDPQNTRAEFKRLMGSAETIHFPGAGKALLPEELSAYVLRSLLADAGDVLGFGVSRAVISTPALFEVPQNHATSRAGALAGLEEVVLIQEPIASAIAAGWRHDIEGAWLVFDLGGGTLDVSLLKTRDGFLRVIGHTGDNFLGGRDIDGALVDWAVARIKEQHRAEALARSNPEARPALVRLKAACEQAKIELSRATRTSIVVDGLAIPGGEAIDVELEVDRSGFELLIEPLVARGLAVCERLLESHRYGPDAVGRVVLVGGPTLTPLLRQRLSETFSGRLAEGIDPMTIVARGAALYAATTGLAARTGVAAPHETGVPVQLEHPALTSDLRPYVVGRFLAKDPDERPTSAWLERADGGFKTDPATVGPEGGFVAQVELAPQRENRFRLCARGVAGPVAVRQAELRIVHGVTVADPPLSRSLGVARSNDTVHVYFEKGTPLPARRSFFHQTTVGIEPGGAADVLRIPVVQGEFFRAHRNRLIGTLQVRGSDVTRAIPPGARIEVTLQLDRSGQLRARADLPETGEQFSDVVHVHAPSASPEAVGRELEATERRVAELRRRADATEAVFARDLERAEFVLVEARKGLEAARGGDADAAQRALRLLLDLNGEIDAAEQVLHWPELEAEAQRAMSVGLSWNTTFGTPVEQQMFQEAIAALREGLETGNAGQVDRQIAVMNSLGRAAFNRDPDRERRRLEWFQARMSEATDLRRANELLKQGREALRLGKTDDVKSVNRQLDALFPGTAEERQRSFGSGVS